MLEKGDTINPHTPVLDLNYNRMLYKIENQSQRKFERTLIVPILNQRKIQLIREKPNCIYNYSSFVRKHLDQEKTFFMCVNQTLYKYYIYNCRGILLNRISYAHLEENYGFPICCSSDGLKYLFKKIIFNTEDKFSSTKTQKLSILEFNETEVKVIKEINLMDAIDRCYAKQMNHDYVDLN